MWLYLAIWLIGCMATGFAIGTLAAQQDNLGWLLLGVPATAFWTFYFVTVIHNA